jgi:O-antigen/teichoic acid export membrane protein
MTTTANANSRQLLLNFTTGYVGLFVSLILSLFLTPIVLRELGTSRYGLWIAITSIGTYVSLLGAGVSTAAVQRIASCIAVKDEGRLAEVLATARAFFWVSGGIAFLLTAALAPFIGHLFRVTGSSLRTAEIAMLLTGLCTCAGLLNSTPAAAIYGSGMNSRLALLNAGLALSTQGLQITVVLLGGGLLGLFAVAAAGAIATFLGTDFIAKRSGVMNLQRTKASRSMLRELLRSGRRNVLLSISGTISYQLDAVTVGIIRPVGQVAPYDLGLSTSGLTQSVATAGTSLLIPTYAQSSASDDLGRQFRLFSRAVLISMAISIPVVTALAVFGQSLLRLWLREVPQHTYDVMLILNIIVVLQLPGLQAALLLVGKGRNGLVARIALPASVANLAGSVIATFWFGPAGPAIGSLPQVVIVELILLPAVACHILEVPVRRYLREAIAPLAAPLATSAGVAVILVVVFGRGRAAAAPFECVAVCGVAWCAAGATIMKTDPDLRRFVHNALAARRRRPE